jgi:E3 ubiquitin-protein ligase RNF4
VSASQDRKGSSEDIVILRSSSIVPFKTRAKKNTRSVSSSIIDLSVVSEAVSPSSPLLVHTIPSNKPTTIQCAVCLDLIDKADLQSTFCGHIFCRSCIMMAIKNTQRCPLCRKKLTPHKIHPLYI